MKEKTLKVEKLYSEKEIQKVIKKAAFKIFQDFSPLVKREKELKLVFVAILSGATRFRNALSTEVGKLFAKKGYYGIIEEEDISISTYPTGTKPQKPKILLNMKRDIKNANVIIAEDIIDTGKTLSFLMSYLKKKNPAKIKIYVLVNKMARQRKKIPIDFAGFKIKKNIWLVGYGMDLNGKFRELPYIGYIIP